MTQTETTEITRMLAAVRAGEAQAGDRLFTLVYGELRRSAAQLLAAERPGHTYAPTDLVHETWLRLGVGGPHGMRALPAADRAHFFGITVRAMRQVLVDHARRRVAQKRGAGAVRVTLDDDVGGDRTSPEELLALFDALERLGEVDGRLRKVVEYRYLAGLSEEEVAEALAVTTRTVQRDWVKARAWLYRQLYDSGPGP
jgi:RNA polymerase sigma factor (TIGR02999 family)